MNSHDHKNKNELKKLMHKTEMCSVLPTLQVLGFRHLPQYYGFSVAPLSLANLGAKPQSAKHT